MIPISFLTSLRLIRDEFMRSSHASAGAIPRHLVDLRANLEHRFLGD